MAENQNDSPALYEENLDYLRDPENPRSKPYSTKQQAAHDAVAAVTMLYHSDTELDPGGRGKTFQREEVEQAMADGWSDVPFEHPNNPKHVHPSMGKQPEAEAATESPSAERSLLMEEARRLGLKPAHNIGIDKLQAMIAKASEDGNSS